VIIELDHQIIPDLPYTWRMALTQGNTGVVATPSESQTNNIVQLANDLVAVIKLIGSCTVNSWLRTPIHNIQVGGSPHSAHLLGAAVDLHPVDNTVADCKALLKTQVGRVLYFEINTTNWLHLDFVHNHDFIA
jgi:zinc D-Ala-D-Ala carboxypeptidase